jgi:hypothetical protein
MRHKNCEDLSKMGKDAKKIGVGVATIIIIIIIIINIKDWTL